MKIKKVRSWYEPFLKEVIVTSFYKDGISRCILDTVG